MTEPGADPGRAARAPEATTPGSPRLYFDNNATTAVDADVVASMLPFFRERFGNPSSTHAVGEDAADAVRGARASVARLIGARSPNEVVFTSGGTESINTAIHAATSIHASTSSSRSPRRTIVTGTTEHSAVLEPLEALETQGFHVVRVPVDEQGRLARAVLFEALTRDVALVTLLLANNETGVVNELSDVGARCRELDVPFHVDAVQAAGKMPLDPRAWNVDLLSISAHKLHGPKGVGALWVREGFACAPLLRGGSQERRVRPGTENVPAIVGFGRAAELARAFAHDEAARARLASLRDRFERGILERVPGSIVHGAATTRVPNTTNVRFADLDAEALLALFSEAGLFASAGSACHAQARKPSHVLLAMGASEVDAAASVRFSLSRHTTAEDVDAALEIVASSCALLAG